MKKLLLSIILCSLSLLTTEAQVLYEISGRSSSAKSYILATNRLVDYSFADSIPNLFQCFSRCKKLITEFSVHDYEAIAALRTAALLPDSVLLSNFYTESEYEQLDQALQLNLGMGLNMLSRMKPAYITELYRTELLRKWLGYNDQRSLEVLFAQVAEEREIPIISLDNLGETLYMLFDREPFHWQCDELKQITEYPEREIQQEREILNMYRNGRLNDIAFQITSPDNKSTISFSDYKIYSERNTQWVRRLQPYLKDGNVFITLNAIYLGGDHGLLAQLREAGYRVRAVNRHQHKLSATPSTPISSANQVRSTTSAPSISCLRLPQRILQLIFSEPAQTLFSTQTHQQQLISSATIPALPSYFIASPFSEFW